MGGSWPEAVVVILASGCGGHHTQPSDADAQPDATACTLLLAPRLTLATLAPDNRASTLTAADLDHDGRLDLVVASGDSAKLFLGVGDGTPRDRGGCLRSDMHAHSFATCRSIDVGRSQASVSCTTRLYVIQPQRALLRDNFPCGPHDHLFALRLFLWPKLVRVGLAAAGFGARGNRPRARPRSERPIRSIPSEAGRNSLPRGCHTT